MSIRLFNANLTCTSTLNVTQPQKNIGIAPATFLVSSFFTCSDFVGITKRTTVTLTAFDLGITYSPSTSYSVSIPYGFFLDISGNPIPGTTLTYTTPSTGPTFNTSNPMPGTSSYGGTNITINFNRWVDRGTTGSIKLYNSSGLVYSFAITDTTNITFVNGSVVVNLFQYLRDNTNYYVTIDAGCVIDEYKFTNSAITASNVIYFTTGNNYTLGQVPSTLFYNEDTTETIVPYIQIVDLAYADSSGYTITVTPSDVQAVISLSVPTGQATSSFNSATKVLTLTGTRTQINNSLQNITLIPGGNYELNYSLIYSLTTPRSTNISKAQTVQFGNATQTTNCPATYVGFNYQTTGSFLGGYSTLITDLDPTGAQFTVTLTSLNGGLFSTYAIVNGFVQNSTFIKTPQNPISFTGTKAQVNSFFNLTTTQINYHAVPGGSSDTIVYSQTKSTDTTESTPTTINIAVTLVSNTSGSSGSIWGDYKIIRGSNTQISFDQLYYGIVNVELVGGGGGGVTITAPVISGNPVYLAAGAGGGGGYAYHANLSLTQIALNAGTNANPTITSLLTVGAGGIAGGGTSHTFNYSGQTVTWNAGANGGNTTFAGYIAYGGGGGGINNPALYGSATTGAYYNSGGQSGNSGLSSNSSTDDHYIWDNGNGYLGGAGSAGVSTDVTYHTVGGPGMVSAITGYYVGVGGYGCDGNTADFYSRYNANAIVAGATNIPGHGGTGSSGNLLALNYNTNGNGADGYVWLRIYFR